MNKWQLKWHEITHWEYWPSWMIYYPLFPIWLFFALKARSLFFFNAANPRIKNGGMAMESKHEIDKMVPADFVPKSIFMESGISVEEVEKRIEGSTIEYPFIAKPDIGLKAFAVEKIHNREALKKYVEKIGQDFLVQEFIPFPKEMGIFYVRFPDEQKGRVTALVGKEFLKVTGDGKSEMIDLIKKIPRSFRQLDQIKKGKLGSKLHEVPNQGEEVVLVPYGSHTRGALFIDRTAEINPSLQKYVDDFCRQVPDFHYGRLDVLYSTFEELSQGKNFKVIEINGAGGEVTHIYDPKHSLFFGWKEIFRHWNMLCNISIKNHKKGHRYLTFKEGRQMLKDNSQLEARLKSIT